MRIRDVRTDDLETVCALLTASALPTEGVADQFEKGFAVAEAAGHIVGVAGLEIYGDAGLLRSVAVAESSRGSGIGEDLVEDRIRAAERMKLRDIYLLTTTAASFFEKRGFVRIDRADAAPAVQQSPEFALMCDASSTAMRLGTVFAISPGAMDRMDNEHNTLSEPLDEEDLALPERRKRRAQFGTMRAVKAAHASDRTRVERVADRMTRLASTSGFFAMHILWFGTWIVVNKGLTPLTPFDPFPFGLLTMVVSLEAIFLSIFVLMTQNRESYIAELREELALQVNLRIEQEVTKTLQLVAGLYTRMGHRMGDDPELHEMLEPLRPEEMEKELMLQIKEAMRSRPTS